jgi:hypothetical protein
MRRFLLLLFFVASFCRFGCAQKAASATMTQAELVRRTQEMMDAIATGNQSPWKKYFAEDAKLFSEKGATMDKKALIADITPLPAGYSGTIKVEEPQSWIEGNVAVFGYVSNETETIFGQQMHARYHSTDTWVLRDGEWKIVASQVMRYYEDPAPGKVNAAELKDYPGKYELAPGKTVTVTQEADKLFEQKGDRPKVELIPEAGPVFFRKGVEGRTVFERGSDGKVEKLIERRNNEDIIWKRATEKRSGKESSSRLSKSSLTAERLAVYKAFLRDYDRPLVVKELRISQRTYPLSLGIFDPPADKRDCFGDADFTKIRDVHLLDDRFKQLHEMRFIDPDWHTDMLQLSEISFDKTGLYALLQFEHECWKMCGNRGGFAVYERVSGTWQDARHECPGWIS